MNSVISTRSLTKYYGRQRGIIDVNLDVSEGEIFGFIGPNGAGKSTTIRTLLDLIRKTSGEALIFGLDTRRDKVEIAKNVGYLPSEVFYYDNMRAIDLFRYSASFYGKDCSARISELSETLQLDVKMKIEDMSLGNKKKVGIIQGLLHSPRLIILDEPTSGLDPLMQKTFFELIKKENAHGATILFSSHILSEVQRICDRVAIIKDGRIIDVQKIGEMLDNSYKNVTLTVKDPALLKGFSVSGAQNVAVTGGTVTFIYKGDVNALLGALVRYPLANVDITEPPLEDIFMHYYAD